MKIRLLTADDWQIWKKIRLEALQNSPITDAKSKVLQLHLTCVTSNQGAIQFYQKHGFKIYGTEPRALKIGNIFFDEHLMVLDLSEH